MTFNDLKIAKDILDTLERLGYKEPTPIQAQSIPHILKGKDIIGQAATGTGKTAAFALPIIEKTIPKEGIQHVILAPSRELAKQIHVEFTKLASSRPLKIVNIIGGVSYDVQRVDMLKKPEILIATPGRLIDHLESMRVAIDLSGVKTLTLDEADEMVNFGFYNEILRINRHMPQVKQTIFFTATTNKRTTKMAQELLNDPARVTVSSGLSASKQITQQYVIVKEQQKLELLNNILAINDHKSAIVFCKTRHRVDQLAQALADLNFKVRGIQGEHKQRERTVAMRDFRTGRIQILVGTDVLARGIDVDTVDLVVNYDLPTEIEYYTHRIGRTGRAGRNGKSIAFVKHEERGYFKQIMQRTNSSATHIMPPTSQQIEQHKIEKLDVELSQLLHQGRSKFRSIGARITAEYTPEHLGLIAAAATLGRTNDHLQMKLTPSHQSSSHSKSRHKNYQKQGKSKAKPKPRPKSKPKSR